MATVQESQPIGGHVDQEPQPRPDPSNRIPRHDDQPPRGTNPLTGGASGNASRPRNRRRAPNADSGSANASHSERAEVAHPARQREQRAHGTSGEVSTAKPPGRRHRPPKTTGAAPTQQDGAGQASDRRSSRPGTPEHAEGAPASSRPDPRGKNVRRNRFNASLTDQPASSQSDEHAKVKPSEKYRSSTQKDDLTSTLTRALSTAPYPDCLICFAPMHPAQPTWSCSPNIPPTPPLSEQDGKQHENDNTQCCWNTFHLKCIRAWASKSVKDVAEAWAARGEDKGGEWRCPGCQTTRRVVPAVYVCFCGSTTDPKPPRLATPHSCGSPCRRPRVCGHPCPLPCHPGPCPPCQVTTRMPCHCGSRILSFRCASLLPSLAQKRAEAQLSCGKTCGQLLGCGKHTCEDACHTGPCKPCTAREKVRCYCGREEREVGCGEGEVRESEVLEGGEEKKWVGRFQCENTCDRPFDCGTHRCSQPCHSPSRVPPPCPRSPSILTHCPCGKHEISPSSAPYFPPGMLLARTSCTDPVPTCESICMKPLEGCEHACAVRCHTGPCPPCSISLVRPCRCGSSTRDVRCSEYQAGLRESDEHREILCDRPCGALRACGRHQCTRLCCPLASLAGAAKGKGKKRVDSALELSALAGDAGWHECDLVCGKLLGCGNHRCEERDHRGVCPPCLRSSFEEMVCYCGRTILEPPIPCGTRIRCTFPCSRPPPLCGHPKTQHSCHEDPTPCPPCPFLATKQCACGKKMVDNVKCSQEKVSCGQKCGKLLACGFHHCERTCHGDACGACSTACGKARKLCLPAHHPCPHPCHAPASCSETEPCPTVITITCPCGRIRTPIQCGRSTSNPAGREASQVLKCSNECLVAKRNARLAEALGISPDRADSRAQQVTYKDELTAHARADPKFCQMVEKTFADFLASDRKSQILPHMPESRRSFVHNLAAIYRIDTQMVDQEPKRSVQLIRRIDSRVPTPLLSSVTATASAAPSAGLGRLADLRAPASQAQRPRVSPTPTRPTSAAGSGRGWTSVVTRAPLASASPTEWLTARPGPTPSPAPPRVQQPEAAPVSVEDVPEDWEDTA
ncbi:hypothetical protein OBBRIDRAFT_328385 [Obba rivulosa]|uniref:R3H domain-containing protein n=1 Tax=Obba rivulosa TaxID=1052685 RepID=A0A8E2DPG6_9APHY|nr:hypothetical protein OBBRIDRAFT_328385 [Obba rivulosa]